MKKLFRIASYDFKRLLANPLTIVGMIIVLVVCLIAGIVVNIEPAPAYSASTSGDTTKEIYNNFASNSLKNIDTKLKLDAIFDEGKTYLKIQEECYDYEDLTSINTSFKGIKANLEKYKETNGQSCIYIENNSIAPIKTACNELTTFVEHFRVLQEFESNIIFKTKQFELLETVATYFSNEVNKNVSITQILDKLSADFAKFDTLDSIVKSVFVWKVDDNHMSDLKANYVEKAETKLSKIITEINYMITGISDYETEHINEIKSLITNYKLTCESAKYAIDYDLKLTLEKHFGSLKELYHYQPISLEDTQLALTKINYFLDDQSVYYSKYQAPLNFNSASYEVSMYDCAYFIMAIVGFLTVLFGIFCAYKLFGRDRKNGKMDIILSQNVTFGQVFAGKFLAIIYTTSFILASYGVISLLTGLLFYPSLTGSILAVFNLTTAYTIHPLAFFIIKLIGFELQAIFWATITVFLMNISRKFDICFAIAIILFAVATICNIFLNGSLIYCLFPFIHADLTSFLGGATTQTGFLVTSLYAYGNFFISVLYYIVIVVLLYNFTKQLFKKN